jgi:uncharacterized spore protein YtfJ
MSEAEDHIAGVADRVEQGFARFADVSAARIFGSPIEAGGRTVIPAAAFDIGGGFGFGGGSDTSTGGSGSGGGGGGHTMGRPVAVIEVTPDGVRVRPVLDWTRIGITAIAAALTVWRASRRTRSSVS